MRVSDLEKRAKPVASSAKWPSRHHLVQWDTGKMIAQAMQKVGNEGVITVEQSLETEVDIVEGMKLTAAISAPISSPTPKR